MPLKRRFAHMFQRNLLTLLIREKATIYCKVLPGFFDPFHGFNLLLGLDHLWALCLLSMATIPTCSLDFESLGFSLHLVRRLLKANIIKRLSRGRNIWIDLIGLYGVDISAKQLRSNIIKVVALLLR